MPFFKYTRNYDNGVRVDDYTAKEDFNEFMQWIQEQNQKWHNGDLDFYTSAVIEVDYNFAVEDV